MEAEYHNDQLGWSVALSGDGSVVAGGAINNDDAGDNAGHVRVRAWSGTDWVQVGPNLEACGRRHLQIGRSALTQLLDPLWYPSRAPACRSCSLRHLARSVTAKGIPVAAEQ